MEQSAQVELYFNRISADYQSRYTSENPYHNYFFRQRMAAAIDGLSFDGKSVLDIGAGTGSLYDELISKFSDVDYFGCDISKQMLARSSIPANRAFVGQAHEMLVSRTFDFIFSLGVTTYQTPSELENTLHFIGNRLALGGTAVISFTNRASLDNLIRKILKFAKPIAKGAVIGQSFCTYAYTREEVTGIALKTGLTIARLTYLNQTFSPFNTFFPRTSVALAGIIEQHAPAAAMPILSSDFMIVAELAR